MKRRPLSNIGDFYTKHGVAERLGRSMRWVEIMQSKGEITHFAREGKILLYKAEDVERLYKTHPPRGLNALYQDNRHLVGKQSLPMGYAGRQKLSSVC